MAGLGGGVLAGALGLELGGVEDAVAAVGADGEGLSVVLEGVGWGFGAFVVHAQGLALLDESELGVGTGAGDGAGLHVACDAEVDVVGPVAHGLELGDGDVVALGIARAGDGEPGDDGDDEGSGDEEADWGFRCGLRHTGLVYAR